jgi:hypothetical protein
MINYLLIPLVAIPISCQSTGRAIHFHVIPFSHSNPWFFPFISPSSKSFKESRTKHRNTACQLAWGTFTFVTLTSALRLDELHLFPETGEERLCIAEVQLISHIGGQVEGFEVL